jgi:glycoprotein endo-alpha-1,2-mannosidase
MEEAAGQGASATAQASPWLNRPIVGKVEKRVLALYYPWYRTPAVSGKWAHQDGVEPANKRMASHTHYPLGGPYDSSDPKVIERHLNQAKEAGIDTLVCSWWGRQDPTDRAIRLLLDRAPAHGLSVCIYWERLSPRPDRLAAAADLAYLLQTFGEKPGYLRLGSRPVLFLNPSVCRSLSAADWEEVLALQLKRLPSGFVPIGSGDTLADCLLWDGLHRLDVATPMPEQNVAQSALRLHEQSAQANLLARRLGHIAVETVLPGYDDRKPNATSALPGRKLVLREEGALYKALFAQAAADGADWVLISSFNQWHNGTEIEPSEEMGSRYLTLSRELSSSFMKGVRHGP